MISAIACPVEYWFYHIRNPSALQNKLKPSGLLLGKQACYSVITEEENKKELLKTNAIADN